MPRGDRTGPWGDGPMTGRGVGLCAGAPSPGWFRGSGRGRGRRGMGPGRGRRWASGWSGRGVATADPVDEKTALQSASEGLRAQLEAIEKRLRELEGE